MIINTFNITSDMCVDSRKTHIRRRFANPPRHAHTKSIRDFQSYTYIVATNRITNRIYCLNSCDALRVRCGPIHSSSSIHHPQPHYACCTSTTTVAAAGAATYSGSS